MKKSASEIIRNLETRIAKLERQSNWDSYENYNHPVMQLIRSLEGRRLLEFSLETLDSGASAWTSTLEDPRDSGQELWVFISFDNSKNTLIFNVGESMSYTLNVKGGLTPNSFLKESKKILSNLVKKIEKAIALKEKSREEAKRLKSIERAKAKARAKAEAKERALREEKRRNAPPTLDQIRRVIERMDSYHNVHVQGNELEVDLEYRYADDYTDEDMEIQERNYARFEKDLLKACPKLKKYWNKQVEMILQDKGFLSIIFDSSYMQLLSKVAKLEKSSGIFQKAPRPLKPNSLTLVESESGFHKFEVGGNATLTFDDVYGVIRGAIVYTPSSQWYLQELDREARDYSGGEYSDYDSYSKAFQKLFNKIIKKHIKVSTTRSGDTINVFFNPQGLFKDMELIYKEGLDFRLNSKIKRDRSVLVKMIDNAIRTLES